MENELNYVSTIDLTETTELYQFVYASQLYGTMFGIYAKFTISNTANSQKVIDKINFRLVNYKGLINIGFYNTEYGVRKFSGKKGFACKIDLRLKGLSMIDSCDKQDNDSVPFPIPISNGKRILVNRILEPLHGIDYNHIKEEVDDPLDDNSKLLLLKKDKTVFDEEYFYRDGYYGGQKSDNGKGYIELENSNLTNEQYNEGIGLTIASWRCHQSVLNVSIK